MPDDRTLLLRTHKGHEPSARALWERHAPAMLALAGAVLRGRGVGSADDVVQAAFCRVLETERRRLRDVRDVRAWLCQTTRRLALNELRARRRERARRERVPSKTHHDPRDVDHDLARALDALPRRLREVVVLKHAAGLTFDQIATALDLPRTTAASRYQAALERLRASMLVDRQTPQDVAHG